MPSVTEIQIAQKELLFQLLMIEKLNEGKRVEGLSIWIFKTKAGMTKEDIAFVEQLILQL